MSDLPYRAENATSGKSVCKYCTQKIVEGSLRLSLMIQTRKCTKKLPIRYHESCFFLKYRPRSVDEIANFNNLDNADQRKLANKIDEINQAAVVVTTDDQSKDESRKRRAAVIDPISDFLVEISKNNRARCNYCRIVICKDEVRIRKTVYHTEIGRRFGGQPLWHHAACFAEARRQLGYLAAAHQLPGFATLPLEHQQRLADIIKPLEPEEVLPIKKMKLDQKSDPEQEEDTKIMEAQNDLYQKYRTALGQWARGDINYTLKKNRQVVPRNKRKALDLLADGMAFGALERCPECKWGQLVLDTFCYKCTGYISDYSSCPHKSQNPCRRPLKLPSKFADRPGFEGYVAKVDKRLFRAATNKENIVKKEVRKPPLKNLQFLIYGRELGKDRKEQLKRRVLRLGGLVLSRLAATAAAVISTRKDVERMSDKMAEIQEQEIEVVPESFLDLIDPETGSVLKTVNLIRDNDIAGWGCDPVNRVPQAVLEGRSIDKCGNNYANASKSRTVKITIKGGAVVEEGSGLAGTCHVVRGARGPCSAWLSRTDRERSHNDFYKLQLLQRDDNLGFHLFTAWGSIGSEGEYKIMDFYDLDKAMRKFKSIYFKKTKNQWDNEYFYKVPGAYYSHDVQYGAGAAEAQAPSRLPPPLQGLLRQIFDITAMENTIREFELDIEKLPLGNISEKQIMQGYEVLTELLKYFDQKEISQNVIISATSKFFSLIPHKFRGGQLPLLDSRARAEQWAAHLDTLLEIDTSCRLRASDSEGGCALDESYSRLRVQLEPLAADGDEARLLRQAVSSTHAPTHSHYSLEIQQVFRVARAGEEQRFAAHRALRRRLLWHGSRAANVAGILAHGLRIAPPEAPSTGYMFGKGIYFADVVSKSANYCCCTKDNPDGILLLCEVALGNMKECTHAEYVRKLPSGVHSVAGRGRWRATRELPLPGGAPLPLGPLEQALHPAQTELLYDEFIVYDVAQVNVRYLLQVKFNFKY